MSNPIAPYINDMIGTFEKGIDKKIATWNNCIGAARGEVTDFYGKKISFHGIAFAGTVVDIFWNFFDPFIKDFITRSAEKVRIKAMEASADVIESLHILQENMYNSTSRIYKQMAEKDRLMSGKGFPKQVPLRPVHDKIYFAHQEIDRWVNAEIGIYNSMIEQQQRNEVMQAKHDIKTGIFTGVITNVICFLLGCFVTFLASYLTKN